MKYIELKIEVNRDQLELLEAELDGAGFDSLMIDDPADVQDIMEHKDLYKYDYINSDLTKDQDRQPVITLYFGDDEEGLADCERAKGIARTCAETSVIDAVADDQDWLYKWQEYFKPTRVAERIVVKPTWEKYDAAENDLVIEIDPGMAFGTGTHETTSMCLKALEKYVRPDSRVLDVGCGSGILAIGAALLGAEDSLGIEIDTDAVEIAKKNVELNGLSDRISIQYGDLTKGVDYKADIVVANLMADLVIMLSKDVSRHLEEGGIYITSGIIDDKEELVAEAIRDAGYEILEIMRDGEWRAIVARN